MVDKPKIWQDFDKRIPKYLDVVSVLFIILVFVFLLSTILEHLEHPNLIWGVTTIITIITVWRVYCWVKEFVRRKDERDSERDAALSDAFWAVKAVKIRINLLIELQEKSQLNAEDIKAMETLRSLLEPHEALNMLAEIEKSIEKALYREV